MQNDNILKEAKKVYFLGIGGIGISAIARMMLENKVDSSDDKMLEKIVSGSDRSLSELTNELKGLGANVFEGHSDNNLADDTDLVIYSPAIPESNPVRVKAKKLGIPELSYPEALGLISKDKYTIAVSGTHGKTTTTAMLGEALIKAGLNPTIVVGSLFKGRNSNFVAGESDYLVCEACEYKRSFLNLHPNIVVITNIDLDHLDYYKDLEDMQSAFIELVSKIPKDGYLVCDPNHENLGPVVEKANCNIVDYSTFVDPKLKVPGKHNLDNAKAVLAVAKAVGVNEIKTVDSLENFEGVWRRFEHKGVSENGAVVYDDYAHHPTEIKASLKGAREFFGSAPAKKGKIRCVFQPHLYSRTKLLLDDFAESFGDVDEVIIADIYAAREVDNGEVHAKDLVNGINKKEKNIEALYFGSFEEIEKYLKENAQEGDVIITMGAGDIYKVGERLVE